MGESERPDVMWHCVTSCVMSCDGMLSCGMCYVVMSCNICYVM